MAVVNGWLARLCGGQKLSIHAMPYDNEIIYGQEINVNLTVHSPGKEIYEIIRDCVNAMKPYIKDEISNCTEYDRPFVVSGMFMSLALLITDRLVTFQNQASKSG